MNWAEAGIILENPIRLLSSVQIGITLVGILTGVDSGAVFAEHLAVHAEAMASVVAVPMLWVARLASPLVWLLQNSTEAVARLLRCRVLLKPPLRKMRFVRSSPRGRAKGFFSGASRK